MQKPGALGFASSPAFPPGKSRDFYISAGFFPLNENWQIFIESVKNSFLTRNRNHLEKQVVP